MIEKKTVIDQIEIARDGRVQIRFALILIEDGVEIGSRWHRTVVEPGVDVDAQLAAVNADITTRPELKANAIDVARITELKTIIALVHTPAVIQAALVVRAAAEKKLPARAEA